MASVLVIEDEAPRLRLMAWFLIEAGHEVASVPTADQAIQRVAAYHPDIIIFNTVITDDEKQRCIENLRRLSPRSRVLDISEEKTRMAHGLIGIQAEGNLHPDGFASDGSPPPEREADYYLRVPFNADALVEAVRELLAS